MSKTHILVVYRYKKGFEDGIGRQDFYTKYYPLRVEDIVDIEKQISKENGNDTTVIINIIKLQDESEVQDVAKD